MNISGFAIGVMYLLTGLCSLALLGQSSSVDYLLYYKMENQQLYVRWEPQNLRAFQHAIQGKLRAELQVVEGPIVKPSYRSLEARPMAPLDKTIWRKSLSPSSYDTLALVSVYAEELDKTLLNQSFLASDYDDGVDDEWTTRFNFNVFFTRFDWQAIERSGMGFRRPLEPNVALYAFKLFPTPSGDTLYLDINAAAYQPADLPPLTGVYKGKVVEMQWRTLEYREDYFAWLLERSRDGGTSWEVIYDPPILNINDTLAAEGDALKYIYHIEYLEEEEEERIFRLRGVDQLGGISKADRLLEREGNEDISLSPQILQTIQTDSNFAIIQWEYDTRYNRLLEEFRIVVADTTGKEVEIALEGIDPSSREASVFMKYRSNFYRVQAVSKLGTVLSSFESLVLMYDDEPPAVPSDFQGYIDSSGLAHLSWVTSDEIDLAGYYLFKGYFEKEELAMITPEPLPGPAHIDSVNMEIANEWVFYQLRSVDTRGNASAFTPMLPLKKPDIYPPAAPRITAAKASEKAIQLAWTTSPSADVASYKLYKRIANEEEAWSELLVFDKAAFVATYTDSLVTTAKVYEYTMQAIDDDGLVSDYCQPVSVRLKDFGLRSPITDFEAQKDVENRQIVLSWSNDSSPRDYYLYRGVGDSPLSLLKVIRGDANSYTDSKLREGETYKYVMRAYFSNGNASPFTPEIVITLE